MDIYTAPTTAPQVCGGLLMRMNLYSPPLTAARQMLAQVKIMNITHTDRAGVACGLECMCGAPLTLRRRPRRRSAAGY
mgnify:CR=1 FL=1